MDGVQLLTDLQRRGFALSVEGGGVRVAPASQLTLELRSAIANNKVELRALLAGWDSEMQGLTEWFIGADLPTEQFHLSLWRRVIDQKIFRAAILADLAAGPEGTRARMGVLQEDLRLMRERFGQCSLATPLKAS